MAGHDHVEVTKEIIDCSPPLGGSLCDPAHRHSLSPSSRVRASARSARCQPASPSKVDRTDEAAFCAANDPEKFHGTFEQEAAARAVNGRVSAANIRQASPGERVYMAVGDLFEAAEVHDLSEVRAARRAAVDPGGGDEGKDGC